MAEFVKVGFEFTAAPKVSKKITNPNLRLETSYYHSGQTITKRDYSESISKYKWINNEFSSDECGCEVPTPIVTSKEEVIKYYKEFMHFVKSSNLTTNIDEALNGLGGCHIHLDLADLSNERKKLFISNFAIYMSNNPWPNWALNDPNDNINANSLNSTWLKDVRSSVVYYQKNTTLKRKLNKARTPLELLLSAPLDFHFTKHFAIRYDVITNTIELRIFDMPTSLEEHLLHYNIAMAIYNFCLKVTMSGESFLLNNSGQQNFMFFDMRIAKRFLVDCLKELTIKPTKTQLEKMLLNIETRYNWSYDENEVFIKQGRIDASEHFLL